MKTKPPERGICVDATCVQVIDGDTIRVVIERQVDVRILDLWTPESRTKNPHEKALGLKAKQRTTELCLGKTVRVFIPAGEERELLDGTTFGRALGRVFVDGQLVADVLTDEGLGAATKADQVKQFGPGRYAHDD